MTTRSEVTAGTASLGYLTPRTPHPYTAADLDPGQRACCAVCRREPWQHLPKPRTTTEEKR